MKERILKEIIRDLADNYRNDIEVLDNLLDDVINDALFMSNRINKGNLDKQLIALKSNIKKAVKAIYLQRGVEGVVSDSQSGLNNNYDDVMETMKKDIIKQNKRLYI